MNISGIMITIVLPRACCVGSVDTGVIIFCVTHIVAPTRMARKKSGTARFIHKNWLFNGSAEYTTGQSYRKRDRFKKLSGVTAKTRIIAWYRAIQMGIWISIGKRQPAGLTPDSLYSFICSWASFCLSLPCFFWSSASLG